MKNILIIALALFTSTLGLAQKKERLELRLVKGQTYAQNMTSDIIINQEIDGKNMEIKMSVIGKMSYNVTDVRDTIYDIAVNYESMTMKMDMLGNMVSFSSDEGNTDMLSKILRAMTKKIFNIKLNSRGRVVEVKNMENLYSTLSEFTEVPEAQKQQIKTQLSESFGEDAIKGNLEMSLALFPSIAIAKGETWNIKNITHAKMSMAMDNTFTLKDITDSYYLVALSSKLSPDPKADFVMSNGFSMKYSLSGTMAGEIKIDKKTGWIISGAYEQHLNGATQFKSNEQMPDGMTIPMKMDNKITFTNQ